MYPSGAGNGRSTYRPSSPFDSLRYCEIVFGCTPRMAATAVLSSTGTISSSPARSGFLVSPMALRIGGCGLACSCLWRLQRYALPWEGVNHFYKVGEDVTVEIPLTRGLVALVDDDDAPTVRAYTWAAMRGPRTWYAHRNGIRRPDGRYAGQLMHTLLTGWPRVDHLNGNGLDNRRPNLRPASASENARNSRKRQGATSRYKGVHWSKRRRGWIAKIYVPKVGSGRLARPVELGCFDAETAAAHAYDDAARSHFGPFAALNFPLPGERYALEE